VNPRTKQAAMIVLLGSVALVPLAGIAMFALGITLQTAVTWVGIGAAGLMGMAANYSQQDKLLSETKAMPAAASTTVTFTGIDLGHGSRGMVPGECELKIELPALTLAMVPNTKTITVSVYHDDAVAFGSEALLFPAGVIVVTGATGTDPAPARSLSLRLPGSVKRYVRVKIVSGADVTDCSAVSATVSLRF
jgi:hypothetical protein